MECFEIEKKRREIIEFLEKICYPDIKAEMNIYNSLTSCQNADIFLLYHDRQRVIRFDIYRDSISYIKTLIMDAIEHILDEPAPEPKKVFNGDGLSKEDRAMIDGYIDYIKHGINTTYGLLKPYLDRMTYIPKKVILNDPATIIFWSDGTKTVVKKNSKDRKFDPEKGIALCYMKKALGNKGNYNNVFRDWIK